MWTPDIQRNNDVGQFAVYAYAPGKPYTNVTIFRDALVKIVSYSYGDPFSDATAELTFPQLTPFDDPEAPNLWFIKEWTHYDIYWVPATTTKKSDRDLPVINPNTNKKNMWLNYGDKGDPIWEGFSVSYTPSEGGMRIQLQGALYQLDRYLAKPFYPNRPVVMERLIKKMFNPNKRKLETKKLKYIWPAGYNKVAPDKKERTIYSPKGVKPGNKWSGMATRDTGTWQRALTGFVQDLLANMYTDNESGVEAGNQWTVRKRPGRRPVLEVRDRFRPPDFEVWYGTPGVEASLTRDGMATVNIIYGQGVSYDGVTWTRSLFLNKGRFTDYDPVAADPNFFPYKNKKTKKKEGMPAETLIKFTNGVGEDEGVKAAEKMLLRDMDPGWTGNITLKADATASITKWKITAGMTVLLRGWAGNTDGLRLHISEAIHNVEDNSVSLRVDTRYRDLLTLEQVQADVRDPLTPVKMLQVNKRSLLIEDLLVPWDYNQSGMIPVGAKSFFNELPNHARYPWERWTQKNPPKDNEEFYIRCDASEDTAKERWGKGKVIMSQAGSARMVQIVAVDRNGNRLKIPFHVSIYYDEVPSYPTSSVGDPPKSEMESPWLPYTFEVIGPDGEPIAPTGDGPETQPDPTFIVGWGNWEQKAGFSPNRESDGASPTGMLWDESIWSWNMTNQRAGNFEPFYYSDEDDMIDRDKRNQRAEARSLWVHCYAEHTADVYFIGRIYRLEPGV